MNTPAKLILGAVATGCIAVGVAAQTGTIQFPGPAASPSTAQGRVEDQQKATASPAVSPSPEPTQAPAPAAAVVESGPAAKKKKHR